MKIVSSEFAYGNPLVPFKSINFFTEITHNLHDLTDMEKRLDRLGVRYATYLVEYVDTLKRKDLYDANGKRYGFDFGRSNGFILVTEDEAEKYFAVDIEPRNQIVEDESD